jgi:hypothetical protein
MFPSPGILLHYVEFCAYTIAALEKLLGAESFNEFIDHLICHHATFLTSLNRLNLFFVIQITVALTFSRSWTLIALTFIIHFLQDDHLIFLDAVTHVEIGTSLF